MHSSVARSLVDKRLLWRCTETSWILEFAVRGHFLLVPCWIVSEICVVCTSARSSGSTCTWISIWISALVFDITRLMVVSRANMTSSVSMLFLALMMSLVSATSVVLIMYCEQLWGIPLAIQTTELPFLILSLAMIIAESACLSLVLFSSVHSKLR